MVNIKSSEAFTHTSGTTVNGVNASAGGNLTVMAGGDIQLIATDIEAAEDANLQAVGITTAASSLAVGTINNGGRLDRALSDFTRSDSLKSTSH